MQRAFTPLTADRRFRAAHRPEVFTAVLRTVPLCAAWLDVLEPISGVAVMGGLHNRLRRLVVDDRPVATGVLAVGDTVCTTNPTLGRGLSMAVRGACDLVDTVTTHPDDPEARALAMDRAVADHVAPFYADQADIDRARLAQLRHTVLGAPPPVAALTREDRISYPELRTAALFDPVAFRAFWTIMGMLRRPDDVYRDPRLVARVREAVARHGTGPSIAQPGTADLVGALATP
jgi:hypothetical protein